MTVKRVSLEILSVCDVCCKKVSNIANILIAVQNLIVSKVCNETIIGICSLVLSNIHMISGCINPYLLISLFIFCSSIFLTRIDDTIFHTVSSNISFLKMKGNELLIVLVIFSSFIDEISVLYLLIHGYHIILSISVI